MKKALDIFINLNTFKHQNLFLEGYTKLIEDYFSEYKTRVCFTENKQKLTAFLDGEYASNSLLSRVNYGIGSALFLAEQKGLFGSIITYKETIEDTRAYLSDYIATTSNKQILDVAEIIFNSGLVDKYRGIDYRFYNAGQYALILQIAPQLI